MTRMDVGIFQLMPAPETVSDGDVIAQALREVDFAEARGFGAVWIAEHHLSRFGIVGAPSVYAAAVTQRTRRIDVGYAVAVVPLHHPLRLAEEIAWVGHLARGRLLVGVGPGFSPHEFGAWSVPLEERHARLEEGLSIVRGLLGNETFAHDGRFWTVPPVTLRPRPFGGVAPPILRAASGPESLRLAAAEAEPVLLGLRSPREIGQRIALYRSFRTAAGAPSAEVEREVARFRVLRRVVVAEDGDEARADALRALAWEAETARHVHGMGAAPATLADGSAAAAAPEIPGGCVGSAREVREEFEALYALGVRHVVAWLNFGDLPYPKVLRSMELLADDVLPYLPAAAGGAGEPEPAEVAR